MSNWIDVVWLAAAVVPCVGLIVGVVVALVQLCRVEMVPTEWHDRQAK